jgi:hypothetical protein
MMSSSFSKYSHQHKHTKISKISCCPSFINTWCPTSLTIVVYFLLWLRSIPFQKIIHHWDIHSFLAKHLCQAFYHFKLDYLFFKYWFFSTNFNIQLLVQKICFASLFCDVCLWLAIFVLFCHLWFIFAFFFAFVRVARNS